MAKKVSLDPLSGTSLLLEPAFNNVSLSWATGFIVFHESSHYIITNWHVVTGRNADTERCLDEKYGAVPNKLIVSLHAKGVLGQWHKVDIELYDAEGKKIWIEHPLGREVDVVAIPLKCDQADFFPLDRSLAHTDMVAMPATPVAIIGFPLGLTASGTWPIWKTGHIASEPDLDYQNRPAFLIDATTRSGMSGSPVIMRSTGGYTTKAGTQVFGSGISTKFMGIYAGRIHDGSEIGRVWKPFVIDEILAGRLLFNDITGRKPVARNNPCPCSRGERFKNCCGRLA